MQKRLIVIVCGIGGAFLLVDWWGVHEPVIRQRETWVWWAWIVSLMAFPCAMAIQIFRTVRVLGMTRVNAITQPILLAHGINVLLPSMLGDLYEIGALSQWRTSQACCVRTLGVRFSTTMAALGLLAAFAVGVHAHPWDFHSWCSPVGPLVIDQLTPSWSVRIKLPGTDAPPHDRAIGGRCDNGIHIALALLQRKDQCYRDFLLGHRRGTSRVTRRFRSDAIDGRCRDLSACSCRKLGIHHWGAFPAPLEWLGTAPNTLIAINHAWVVLGGTMCIMLANSVFDKAKIETRCAFSLSNPCKR